MWIATQRGLIVITGCCHAGLINTLTFIRSLTDNEPIYAVMGGLHLLHATQQRLIKTCDYIRSIGIKEIIPCHCTGEMAVGYMEETCNAQVKKGGVGKQYKFFRYNSVCV
jgi:7,8-dihydropterin-6-yl-methyl-4-(beta-D-ribofuranosyl)aminobenzene 5'-phosphate synthase